MSTLVSGSSPWCSGAQFLVRYDVRTVAECLSDTDVPLDLATVATNAKLAAFLQASSGKFESAVLMKKAYTLDDLAVLTAPGSNMREWIAEIIADLTAPKVLGRRFIEFPDYKERLKEAQDVLAELAEGKRIFGIAAVIDAGTLDSKVETPADVELRNMITLQSGRYFGRRANRNGLGPHANWDCP